MMRKRDNKNSEEHHVWWIIELDVQEIKLVLTTIQTRTKASKIRNEDDDDTKAAVSFMNTL